MKAWLKDSPRMRTFREWYFREPTTRRQADTYLALMLVFYPVVFLAAFLYADAGLLACWATAILDVLLHIRGQIRTRLPMSIPLALVGVAGILLHGALGWPRWGLV